MRPENEQSTKITMQRFQLGHDYELEVHGDGKAMMWEIFCKVSLIHRRSIMYMIRVRPKNYDQYLERLKARAQKIAAAHLACQILTQ